MSRQSQPRSSSKRKQTSPVENSNSQRRRFLSSSLPDLSDKDTFSSVLGDSVREPQLYLAAMASPTTPSPRTPNPSTQDQPPFFQAQGKTFSLPDIIFGAFKNQNLVNQLAPVLAEAIMPTLKSAVESAFQSLNDTIKSQSETIDKQNREIVTLHDKLKNAEKSNQDLQQQIWGLEESMDELEQYSRRTSLRFHNCPQPNSNNSTDSIIKDICREKLGIQITENDIFRSHPIGNRNNHGGIQIICRFQNWKTKNTVYKAKSKLKNSDIFVTEDLTRYRQGIIHELSAAKRLRKVHSFWTNDGRIFTKLSENGQKYLIKSISELHKIAPPQSDEQQG